MPVSGGAGRSINSTRTPVCKPTPVDLILFLSVRCLSIVVKVLGTVGQTGPKARRFKGLRHVTTSAMWVAGRTHFVTHSGHCRCPDRYVQSACLRRNAGISEGSNADAPLAGVAVRPRRTTAGVLSRLS